MKMKVVKYTAIAAWHWRGVSDGDVCGICRTSFEETCANCRIPGPSCPLSRPSLIVGIFSIADERLAFGACAHTFHKVCSTASGVCPR